MSEKIIEIRKATQKQTITAIKSGDFSIVDKINSTAKKDAAQVFNAVSSGTVPLIWYDLPPVRCQSGRCLLCGTPCINLLKNRDIYNFPAWR